MEWITNLYSQFSSLSELDQFKLITGNVTVYSGGAVAALAYISLRYKSNLLVFFSIIGLILYGIFITISAAYLILDLKERENIAKSIIDARSANLIFEALFPGRLLKREYDPKSNSWTDGDFEKTLKEAIGCGFTYVPQAKRIVFKSHGTFIRSIEIANDPRSDKTAYLGVIEDILEWPDYGTEGEEDHIPAGPKNPFGARVIKTSSGTYIHGVSAPFMPSVEDSITVLNGDIASLTNHIANGCEISTLQGKME